MIECFRITDYALAISSVQKHWEDISEDGSVLKVPDVINEFWVGVLDEGKYQGCFRLGAVTSVLYEVHMCIDGKRVMDYCRSFFAWCLENTDLQKMICNVPEFKSGAISVAERMGFRKQGVNTDSFMKNGKLHALVQLGVTRKQMEDICPKQSHS